jgi:hypothetical protein
MRTQVAVASLLITILSFGCSGQSTTPTSPSAATTASPATQTAATVNGQVSAAATAGIGSAADPLKVQAVGTDLVATVSQTGQFTLGVPSGTVQLHFFGAGTDASVTLSPVSKGDTVALAVTVSGTTAVVQSEVHTHSGGSETEIDGRIESLPPTQPAGTLVVAGQTVTTNADTVIEQDDMPRTFADLAIGQRVHVSGQSSGGAFLATRIEIENDNTDIGVEVNGILSDLSGTELAFQFMVNGRLIKGDAQTVFFGDGNKMDTFANLDDGDRVEVKGQQMDAYVYAVRIHINGNSKDDTDNTEFDETGQISDLGGTCPTLTFMLAGKTVNTNDLTVFSNAGGCDAILAASPAPTLEVKGAVQPDGSVIATAVRDGSDEGDGGDTGSSSFDAKGPIVGLAGACPTVSFSLKGTPIDTNAATAYEGLSCSALANGKKVEVTGTKQANGRVLATKIQN